MTQIRRALLAIALACATMLVAFAQTETGQITGTITDPSGAGVPAATVTVRSTGTGVTRTATTSSDGAYAITNLLPGEYTVSVTAGGFNKADRRLSVAVGTRATVDVRLEIASASATVEVTENAALVNTETQTIGQVVTEREIRDLPNLTRNPYQFVALAGNVSDAGMGTRGAGVSINGQREASTNILLDGASNNDEFRGAIGQQVPLDSVQEFSVLTSNFTAEYGRASGGVVNVVTKGGTNQFHGTAYEFNRVSALSSNSFQNNATGVPKSPFTRNQFGYSAGGPIKRDKLFFFSSTEWIRVRSIATGFAWLPTPQLLARTPANVQSFFNAYGQIRPEATILGTTSLGQLPSNPCTGSALCASIPANLPIFSHVAYNTPTDAGGGYPQNTYMTVNRLDYNLSDKTQIYGRYAIYSEIDQEGVLSNSPYADYDLGQTFFNHNALVSVIHTFSPRWVSQSKAVFNRLTNIQPGFTSRGLVPTMYPNTSGPVSIGADNIAFPGYNPFTPGNGGAFGGPQNLVQLYQDMSYVRGGHSFRFGGTYSYQRDNRTFAAYQTAANGLAKAAGIGPTLNALLAGTYNDINVSVDPKGKFPCTVDPNNCTVTLPASQPNYSRSNRYHEFALYAQDAWKMTPRFTLNLGLRWEYFGTQHNKDPRLDANWYAPGVQASDNLVAYLAQGKMMLAPDSPIGKLWNAPLTNFGPRVGFAWDVTGDGRTSLRAGYGIAYERNFGNVTFNVIQNPPNYAVLALPGPITNDNLGPFAGNSGSLPLGRVGARIVDPNINTAYAHMWNVALERQFARGILWAAEYSGSKGVDLYTISYPNQAGFGNMYGGAACTGLDATGATDCGARVNPAWANSVGFRGNQGFSIYHGLTNRVRMLNVFNSGVDMIVNYTWAHAIDNMSSTFFEAAGIASQYGNANVTINNGNYARGLMDPFRPELDRGDAEFDIRHRVTVAGTWRIPVGKPTGWRNRVLGGWSLNPLFSARTGQPFSIFDSTYQQLPYNTPRAVFNGQVPNSGNGLVATETPNTYNYMTFSDAQILRIPMSFQPGSSWPAYMSGRDAFRSPGWWNLDVGLYKDTAITERVRLQLRAEWFNVFNHANLYVIGNSADLGSGNVVTACYGCTGSTYDRRHMQLAAKIIF